ncbi:c-type cytochrome [Helicobacter mustelae]|uniref:Cytochrome c oxidase subunit III n=1 Tax=Helicobacter mustelae (strain ATCC 43772 / CCUG 25715 / CIP 103759 / LMG 18044 / NCTC 12198 / R85-136P) TaxID=679897 RepID=D3UIR8_HELM1|nr:c-type cytochrome [Helicobacter mustelae]CBG40393.1 cb-type cytochrome C oxidase subunit III [Helicobacter mustelae 12198]SQH71893.1 cb-type cytochrome C oxidase subunit III [Helicobacter mustelae]STP13033.1 cb-type cytochrome C oxidase subunit III [Helicobacter mustelae]
MGWLSDNINLMAFIAAIGILILTIFVTSFYIRKMRDSKAEGELTNHKWDGISEFTNNLPIGWAICFIALILWGAWYVFFGYPLNAYSQIGEFNKEVSEHNKKFEEKWQNLSIEDKIKMGQGIFLVKCSQCHGVDAEGMGGKAQNLTRWGKYQGIEDTMKHGSVGLNYMAGEMPPIVLDAKDSEILSKFVMSHISNAHLKFENLDVEKGKQLWDSATCSSCHGPDGKGNAGLAADLTKYGTPEFLKEVLKKGKKGHIGRMPSFEYAKFNDIQIEALAAFINSLQPLDD